MPIAPSAVFKVEINLRHSWVFVERLADGESWKSWAQDMAREVKLSWRELADVQWLGRGVEV